MAIVSLKWASLEDPNKQPSFQDATGAAPVVPVPTFDSATTTSYTAAITGYDAQFTYTVSASVGTATRTDGNVTVSGLTANQSSTLTVTAANTPRDLSFTSSAAFFSLVATPTLVQATENPTGGTVTITNYDAAATYSVSITAGSATRTGDTITFTGLVRGQSATLTVIASNSSGVSGTATLTVSAEGIGEYEPIATITVPSGGLSTIEFTNIPQDYQHLQLRLMARTTRASTDDSIKITFNSDTASNYALHYLYGNGTSAPAGAATSFGSIVAYRLTGANATASIFGTIIIDILEYVASSKNCTVRYFGGADRNGAGEVFIGSGFWNSTSAISSVTLTPETGANFAQYSTAALYGVKAP